MGTHRQRQRAIAIALLISLVLWNLPFGGLVLYPFKILATWFHEMSHGLVMLLTGAGLDRVEIYRDTSGLAFARSGVSAAGRAAIAAAGYMGTPVFGATILVLGQTRRGARSILIVLGVLLAVSAALCVRNQIGVVMLVAIAAGLLAVGLLAGERIARLLVNFVAAQACINALLDVRVLFRSNLVVNGRIMGASDAHNMAQATFGTPDVWAALWLLWSLVLLFAALRLVYVLQRGARPGIEALAKSRGAGQEAG